MNFYRYLGARLEESANSAGVFDTARRIEGAQRLQSLTWDEARRGRAIVGTPETVAAWPLNRVSACVAASSGSSVIEPGVTAPSAATSAMPSSLSLRALAWVKSNAMPTANVIGIISNAVISATLPERFPQNRRCARCDRAGSSSGEGVMAFPFRHKDEFYFGRKWFPQNRLRQYGKPVYVDLDDIAHGIIMAPTSGGKGATIEIPNRLLNGLRNVNIVGVDPAGQNASVTAGGSFMIASVVFAAPTPRPPTTMETVSIFAALARSASAA